MALITVKHPGIKGTARVPETALKHMDGQWERVDDDAAASAEQPAGNASRDAWADYALTQGATEDEIADLGRDELRDQYSSTEA